MKRRDFLVGAGTGLASTAVAAPAIAQSMPQIKWRLTSSFPKSLDTIYGASETFAKAVAEATDNKFQIQVFASNEIVPGLQAFDAVQNGTVEMCQTALYYYVGKDPSFVFGTVLPFGMNARQTNAWWYHGGGIEALNEFLADYNTMALPGANTGTQMGGFFRKEIKTLEDLKGLKFRIGGLAGKILAKLGVVPQQIAAGEIYPALEKGTIDAAEWIGPYDDEKLGLYKVAPYYYYPGWWDGSATGHLVFNKTKFEELPAIYKGIVRTCSMMANIDTLAKYDARNPPALKRLAAGGAQLRGFSQDILDACYKASNEFYAETAATNPKFKKLLEAYTAFRDEQYLWWQVAEMQHDSYMVRARARK